jgi:hypothetical protein
MVLSKQLTSMLPTHEFAKSGVVLLVESVVDTGHLASLLANSNHGGWETDEEVIHKLLGSPNE